MDPRIAWAVAEMQRRLSEPLHVPDLAGPVNLSPSRFAHLFRSETGTSPGQYLQALRMDHARSLLETTTLPVRTVMRMVGCNDPSHFARDFRRRHGMSPRELRQSHLGPVEGSRRLSSRPEPPNLASESVPARQKNPTDD